MGEASSRSVSYLESLTTPTTSMGGPRLPPNIVNSKCFAQRIQIGEKAVRKCLVNNRHRRRGLGVAVIEVAPAEESHAERSEEPGRDKIEPGQGIIARDAPWTTPM